MTLVSSRGDEILSGYLGPAVNSIDGAIGLPAAEDERVEMRTAGNLDLDTDDITGVVIAPERNQRGNFIRCADAPRR